MEPVQQFHVHGYALVAVLPRMHVHVVHGRYEQAVAIIYYLFGLHAKSVGTTGHVHDAPVLDAHIAMFHNLKVILHASKDDVSLI